MSRGELVEIGGGFRVPEVMAESGARLVEVGTTNRTRRADYERAVGADTALILQGPRVELPDRRLHRVDAGRRSWPTSAPPVVVDIGSGLLDETTPVAGRAARPRGCDDEPGVRQCLAAGAALVTFSGDKLLGGPQAGVIVGRADLVGRRRPPPAGPGACGPTS